MVQRVFLSIIILAGSIFCSAQWTDIIPETSGVFRVIQFKNPAEGLILGDEGVVLRTTDGGKTWYYCPNSLDINFFGFQFMNDILICTYGSDRLYYSTDFGSTWTEKSPLPSATEHVNFLNRETAFASGNYNGMYKSSDSRATWNITWKYPDEENMFSDPNSTVFLNDSVGFACGRVFKSHTGLFGNVLKTTDGGSSWSVIYEDPPYGTNLIQLNITDDSVVYALDESFELVRSENLGESWSRISFNEPEGSRIMDMKATSACFLNPDTIVVISETGVWITKSVDCLSKRYILRTTNGGLTWIIQYLEEVTTLGCDVHLMNDVTFINDSVGFVVGNNKILRTSNLGGDIHIVDTIFWYGIENQFTNPPEIRLFPNPTNGTVNIELGKSEFDRLEVYNPSGQLILQSPAKQMESTCQNAGIHTINLHGLPDGLYLVRIITREFIHSEFIIKSR